MEPQVAQAHHESPEQHYPTELITGLPVRPVIKWAFGRRCQKVVSRGRKDTRVWYRETMFSQMVSYEFLLHEPLHGYFLYLVCTLVPRVFSLSNMAAAGEKTLAHSELKRSLIGAFYSAFIRALSLVYSFQNKDG